MECVECKVLSVKCGVSSVECKVWSGECKVWSGEKIIIIYALGSCGT